MAIHGPSEAAPSAKQLVFLAMTATVVAVIVFLCGVLVGRGVPARRAAGTVATEAAPSGAGTVGIGVPEIAPAPEAESGSPLDALSYFDRLSSTDPASEALVAPADAAVRKPTAAPGAPPPAPAIVVDGGAPGAARAVVVQITALRSHDEARAVADGLVARGYPAFVVAPVPGAPVEVYRVRVGPYADHGEADTVRHRLETEGQFTPFVIQP